MTDEFKGTLFSYLTGNLPKEKGTTEEIFKEIKNISLNDWDDFLPNNGEWTALRIEGITNINKDSIVMYGGYSTGLVNENAYGFIHILDRNFKPIKLFEEFSSGTKLRYIQHLQMSEDGTFYGVDDSFYSYNNAAFSKDSQKRFIMLNNFTNKINDEYILRLQKSYIFPNNCTNFYCKYITKNPNSSHYFLAGSRANYLANTWSYDSVAIIDLKINVGSENEWKFQGTKLNDNGEGMIYGGSFCKFNSDDNISFKVIVTNTNKGIDNPIYIYKQDYSEETWTREKILAEKLYIDSVTYTYQCVFINENEVFFVLNNQNWGNKGIEEDKYIQLYYFNAKTKISSQIFSEYLGKSDYTNKRGIYLSNNNNQLYILYCKDDNEDGVGDYYYFRYDGKWNPLPIENDKVYRNSLIFSVKNDFNLINTLIMTTTFTKDKFNQIILKENYNLSKYNGEPYINTNALISDNAEIYSNDSLVFARNLYNKSISGNSTVATVEVPNTYLNGINLTSKNLLSETNLTMVEDTNVTQKNIYETLFLNFINSIVVADQSSPTQVTNQNASNYLNNAINTDDGYDNAQLYNKVIINYQDGTNKEISYSYENTTSTSTTIAFGLYTDKLIDNAQMVSNDKTMIYQLIDLSSLELNKNYSIKQKMEVV